MTAPPQEFRSPPPVVKLEKAFTNPFNTIITTARTCYSGKGLIREEDLTKDWTWLARDLYQAGHHTTIQHAYFTFSLDRVSRQFLWSFLHSHPFYNSEQVSQRYVTVKPANVAVPPLAGEALAVYQAAVERQMADYRDLITRLEGPVAAEYYRIFPARRKQAKYARDVTKKAQEIARYVLPVATFAYLYHTVSAITILRYHRCSQQFDAPAEQRLVIEQMVEQVLRHDPAYEAILAEPLALEATPEYAFFAGRNGGGPQASPAFLREFDQALDGKYALLIDAKGKNETVVAESIREVLGVGRTELDDDAAIALVLDPARNPVLGDNLVLTTHDKLSRCLFHAGYTFRKRLSHTADSQDQRHRMTPGSRPVLAAHFTGEPDFITPRVIQADPALQQVYDASMARTWEAINRLRALGVPEEFALYLLPNAVTIRFTESADLLHLHHKHVMRLCYNAQEEIWQASVEEAQQIRAVNPRIGRWLLPPCTVRDRARVKPICPEGSRFCGVKVWALDLDEYRRVI